MMPSVKPLNYINTNFQALRQNIIPLLLTFPFKSLKIIKLMEMKLRQCENIVESCMICLGSYKS